jgi:hypothetical protein
MAEKSKYAGLADLRPTNTEPKGQGAISRRTSAVITPKERTLTGKRSHPDWKQRSVLLKNDSFDEARDVLKRKYNGRDFSELMQALLDQWLQTEGAS